MGRHLWFTLGAVLVIAAHRLGYHPVRGRNLLCEPLHPDWND